MNRRHYLGLLLAAAGSTTGCRSLSANARVRTPVSLTGTARIPGGAPAATSTVQSVPSVATPSSPSRTSAAVSPQSSADSSHPGTLTPVAFRTAPASTPTPTSRLGRLAFIRDGDVWVKDLPDGEERRLTWDGRKDFPRWAPSGGWLQYRYARATYWVMRADGSDTRAVPADTTWSPREDVFAYTAGAGLAANDVEWANPRQLVSAAPDSTIGNPIWSADGQGIAFVESRRGTPSSTGGPTYLAAQLIGKVKADGTGRAVVYQNPDPTKPFRLAGWSPDGAYLLLWHDVYYPSADGGADGYPLLAVPVGGGAPVEVARRMLVYDDFLSWAPGGHALAFVDGGDRSTWDQKSIAVANLPAGAHPLSVPARSDLFPAWSPHGQWIAFTSASAVQTDSNQAAADQRRIWRMRPDGTDKRQLTGDAAFRDERPEWSAHGKAILFARLQGKTAQVWLMGADGSDPRPIVASLTPAPDWFGYFGYINWGQLYDWTR